MNEPNEDTENEPGLRVHDDLYRKGDSFYSKDGEFLYRVPIFIKWGLVQRYADTEIIKAIF